MSSDPTLNPEYPLYGYEYVCSDKNGDMYKKNGEFFYVKVACINKLREGRAEMKPMGEEKPVCVLNYQNDKLNGQCACFKENGHVFECMVKDDILDGPFTEYDENGYVVCQGEYKDGKRVKEEYPSTAKKAAGVAAGVGAGVAAAAATGAFGAAAALLGFGSPGIAAGSVAATAMSTAWTTGIGTGLISAAQSAGALFMNAVGGSYVAATAVVTAPVVIGGAVGYGIYHKLKKQK